MTIFYILIYLMMLGTYLKLLKECESLGACAKVYVAFMEEKNLTDKEKEVLELIYEFKINTLVK